MRQYTIPRSRLYLDHPVRVLLPWDAGALGAYDRQGPTIPDEVLDGYVRSTLVLPEGWCSSGVGVPGRLRDGRPVVCVVVGRRAVGRDALVRGSLLPVLVEEVSP